MKSFSQAWFFLMKSFTKPGPVVGETLVSTNTAKAAPAKVLIFNKKPAMTALRYDNEN
jgi:hypothetical protein